VADLLPGTYVCVRTHGFVPLSIRLFTRSPYDHAFIYAGDGRIIEAQPGGCREVPLSTYAGYPMLADTDESLTDEQRKRVVAKATALLGVPYGYLDIVRLGLSALGLRWRWLTRAADNERAMICSQVVAACGQAAGVDWLCGQGSPAAVTPGMLAARNTMRPFALEVTGEPAR